MRLASAMLASAMLAPVLLVPGSAGAQVSNGGGSAYVHVVRPGETLASIAQRYYGDARRESVLVAENGLTTQGGAAIVVGLRLAIPWVAYHRVQEGESWAQIATRHYGDPRRVSALVEANPDAGGNTPDVGAELLIPYPLRHVARQADTMRRVAQLYYDDQGEAQRLMRFNSMRRQRLSRGQIVLVPLSDLLLSDEGRGLVEQTTGESIEVGAVRELQHDIDEQLPVLLEHTRRGRYAEAVALGNRLLGRGELTDIQLVQIQRELATGYVALDRHDLAIEAFLSVLSRQPSFEPDNRDTSPTVLAAFVDAQRRLAAEEEAEVEADAGAEADAGVAPEE